MSFWLAVSSSMTWLGKLYRYDYRFGYNLLLDEENSIEKKLHTPVREEWEAEDYEIGDC